MEGFRPFHWEEKKQASSGAEYLVRIGDFVLADENGEPEATMYSYSYIGLPEEKEKPVVFAYNGGPGAASSWLHMGILGPKIIEIPGYPEVKRPADFTFGENEDFLIDTCDLVLIDPVGTGYTQVIKEGAEDKYYAVGSDGEAFARFIADWLQKNDRHDAPVYLLGESYGTIRNVVLADLLPESVNLKGIISVGTSLNVGARGSLPVEPNVRRLGANAAGCWYHYHQKDYREEDFIAEAMGFAYGEYAKALLMGSRLPKAQQEEVLDKLAFYSGLEKELLRKQNLRFNEMDFMTRLCPGCFVSMYDSRMTLPLEDDPASGEKANVDIVLPKEEQEPFMSCIGTSIDRCLEQYYDEELERPSGRNYQNETMAIGVGWDYGSYKKDTLALPEELMREKKGLRFLFVNGRFDLSSTFDFMTYYLSQYDLPKDRIAVKVIESGHASYIGEGKAKELSEAVRAFVENGEEEIG
mgnify:CR=1 FL=1